MYYITLDIYIQKKGFFTIAVLTLILDRGLCHPQGGAPQTL